jgi:predicted 3-demethylubiquinone-9 3-methyltransferase (glyoxalase superfamily)
MQTITPFLWFDNQAEEAARFYTGIFKNSKIGTVARYGDAGANISGQRKGTVMTVDFRLDGQEFIALNGGSLFKFTEAISFVVNCQRQKEVDYYWEKLSKGGKKGRCGWLKDKFGVSWQVVPTGIGQLFGGRDPKKSERAMQAMLKMSKLDVAALKKAYEGKA